MTPDSVSSPKTKKLWQNDIFNTVAIPIGLILGAVLIIYGVTKMLSSERNYQDLLQEMRSKTFGNKWVAAYELSKVINSSQIPESEMPQLLTDLKEIYESTDDVRTQEFIVATAAKINHPLALTIIHMGLDHVSPKIKFHGVVALGNRPGNIVDLGLRQKLIQMLKTEDEVLQQAIILVLGVHIFEEGREILRPFLQSPSRMIRYAAATSLMGIQEAEALPFLQEILLLPPAPMGPKENKILKNGLNNIQIANLKINVLKSYQKRPWEKLNPTLERVADFESNEAVKIIAKEILIQLKN